MLTQKKTGTLKHKSSDTNNNVANDVTNRNVTLDNEATPDAAIFDASTAPNAASAITPDAHFLSSWIKLDTELF